MNDKVQSLSPNVGLYQSVYASGDKAASFSGSPGFTNIDNIRPINLSKSFEGRTLQHGYSLPSQNMNHSLANSVNAGSSQQALHTFGGFNQRQPLVSPTSLGLNPTNSLSNSPFRPVSKT